MIDSAANKSTLLLINNCEKRNDKCLKRHKLNRNESLEQESDIKELLNRQDFYAKNSSQIGTHCWMLVYAYYTLARTALTNKALDEASKFITSMKSYQTELQLYYDSDKDKAPHERKHFPEQDAEFTAIKSTLHDNIVSLLQQELAQMLFLKAIESGATREELIPLANEHSSLKVNQQIEGVSIIVDGCPKQHHLTPILYASYYNNLAAIKLLLEYGASVDDWGVEAKSASTEPPPGLFKIHLTLRAIKALPSCWGATNSRGREIPT